MSTLVLLPPLALLSICLLLVILVALSYRRSFLEAVRQRDALQKQSQFWFNLSHRAERDARALGSGHRIGVQVYAPSDDHAVALLLAETKP